MQSICAGGAQLELGQDLDWFERRGWREGGEGGADWTRKKEGAKKWKMEHKQSYGRQSGFVDMTGTLLKLGSGNTYLD